MSENWATTPQEMMLGITSHVLAFRAIMIAMLAKHPVDEASVLALVEPLLPRDQLGHAHMRNEVSGVVSDMMTASQLLGSRARKPPRGSRK